jgi:hypothetical protein
LGETNLVPPAPSLYQRLVVTTLDSDEDGDAESGRRGSERGTCRTDGYSLYGPHSGSSALR